MAQPARPEHVAQRFQEAIGLAVEVDVRQFEGERIYLVSVPRSVMQNAAFVASEVQEELEGESDSVVVTVRPARADAEQSVGPVRDLQDPRVDTLVELLTSRSRTSEAQPSLSYIPNNTANIAQVTGARHSLIFGRRGAGKTALMVEAKRILEQGHHMTAWANAQPLRSEGIERAFMRLARTLLEALISEGNARGVIDSQFFVNLTETSDQISDLLDSTVTSASAVRRFVPDLQSCIKRTTASMGVRLYIFVDDFYYIPRSDQADVLDLLHASTRDADVWLKIASIRHLSRWYKPNPPVGLQTGQDVNIIDLDLSLQNPAAAEKFLTDVLNSYCRYVAISTTSNVIGRQAIDRLAFASGGVPRDFLTLAASAISKARSRSSGRTVGITDVNQAAGDAAKSKIGELEVDLAGNAGFSSQALQALTRVRAFCLDDKGYTYFRVDFRDKESNPDEYAVLSRLLEVRLVHLVDPSVSDTHRVGERSECYTLDLSQYSGYRLKQNIRALDFSDGHLVAKRTRPRVGSDSETATAAGTVVGKTARQVLQILRVAPLLELAIFRDLVNVNDPLASDLETAMKRRGSVTIDELVVELNRPFQEVSAALASLVEHKRVKLIDADGIPAYVLVR